MAGNASAIKYGLLTLGLPVAIAVLPRLFGRLKATDSNWIEVKELGQDVAGSKAPIIIDVRGVDEFNGPLGHISGATNIPLTELPQRLTAINEQEGKTVILVCRTDKRSALAANILEQARRQKPRVLRGGMEAWNRNGLTTV